jgi:hypothetical protein
VIPFRLKEFLRPVLDYSDEKALVDKKVEKRQKLIKQYMFGAGLAISRINKALGNEMT